MQIFLIFGRALFAPQRKTFGLSLVTLVLLRRLMS